MSKLNGMIAIVALLALSQLHAASAVLKLMKQSHSYPEKHVMYNGYAFKEGNLAYAVCDGTASEKVCSVIQRQLADNKAPRTCNLTLKVKRPENVYLTDKISVHAFGQENAILFWGEVGSKSTFNLEAINMSVCSRTGLAIDDPHQNFYFQQLHAHKLVTYDDKFDIFFEGLASPSHPGDGTEIGMRMSFNSDDRSVIDIKNKKEDGDVGFISPIAAGSSDKGFTYLTTKNKNYSLWMVKPDGIRKLLTSYHDYPPAVSATYDVITSCSSSIMDSHTMCTQYDENGDVKFNVTLDQDSSRIILRQALHNSPRGGFLLMIKSLAVSSLADKAVSSDVIRVDGHGKKVGSLSLKAFDREMCKPKTYSMWASGDEYCAASIGQVQRDISVPADNLDVVVNCFAEGDFKD